MIGALGSMVQETARPPPADWQAAVRRSLCRLSRFRPADEILPQDRQRTEMSVATSTLAAARGAMRSRAEDDGRLPRDIALAPAEQRVAACLRCARLASS